MLLTDTITFKTCLLPNQGTLLSTNTLGTTNWNNYISSDIDNQGVVDVDWGLYLNKAASTFSNAGTIDIASGRTFGLQSTVSAVNASGGVLQGFGTFSIASSSSFMNEGTITGPL